MKLVKGFLRLRGLVSTLLFWGRGLSLSFSLLLLPTARVVASALSRPVSSAGARHLSPWKPGWQTHLPVTWWHSPWKHGPHRKRQPSPKVRLEQAASHLARRSGGHESSSASSRATFRVQSGTGNWILSPHAIQNPPGSRPSWVAAPALPGFVVAGFLVPAVGALFPAAVSVVARRARTVALRAVVAGLTAVARAVGPGAEAAVFAEATPGQRE